MLEKNIIEDAKNVGVGVVPSRDPPHTFAYFANAVSRLAREIETDIFVSHLPAR